MFDFRRGPGPRNFLARAEQWKLLFLVLTLGLVIVMAWEARNPEHYAWLWAGQEGPREPADDEETPVDTRFSPPNDPQPIPGTFTSPTPVVPADPPDPPGRYFPGVEPAYLEQVRDNTPFRAAERDAWLHFWEILNTTDEEVLRQASTGRVTFSQLHNQTAEYRGELVTLAGTIHRAHLLKAPENDHGIEQYYQMWLQPADNPSNPIVLYCLYLPEQFPTGMEVSEEIEATGFCFKNWVYAAKDNARTAPLVLARTVRWTGSSEASNNRPIDATLGPAVLVSLVLGCLAIAVLTALVVYRRTSHSTVVALRTPMDADALREIDVLPDVGQQLKNLAAEDDTDVS